MGANDFVAINKLQDADVPEAITAFCEASAWNRFNKPRVEATLRLHDTNSVLRRRNASNRKLYPLSEAVKLRPSKAGPRSMARRSSARAFDAALLPLNHISAVLAPALFRRRLQAGSDATFHLGPYPSAGSLFPIETYVLARRVEGLDVSVYYVDPAAEMLYRLRNADVERVEASVRLPDRMRAGYSFLTLHTCVVQRFVGKYGARGYRFALLESGHLAQNLLLTATAADLGTVCWGGYFDDDVHRSLGIAGSDEHVVHCVVFGREKRPNG